MTGKRKKELLSGVWLREHEQQKDDPLHQRLNGAAAATVRSQAGVSFAGDSGINRSQDPPQEGMNRKREGRTGRKEMKRENRNLV
jgi:hypothetical protein